MILGSPEPFVARPDPRGESASTLTDEWDEQVADLQYRDVYEFSVGHGVAATATLQPDGTCKQVQSVWIPSAEVERVEPARISEVTLEMEALGGLADGADAVTKLSPLVKQYRDWIAVQRKKYPGLTPRRATTASDLLNDAEYAAGRIDAGIALLSDPEVLKAFRITNRAMAAAARRREAQRLGCKPAEVDPPRWRPFQIAYILMTLRGIDDPGHGDRDIVDLLFFPTGGGKTEAYLGLAAFTMVLRRLRHPGLRSCGVSVLMRYTLRLLTLDQLGRAAALMCALELERERDERLGAWPFEIGLWVGKAATPNRMGYKGYDGPGKDDTAYMRTNRYKRDSKRYPRPIPIENCPWCGKNSNGIPFVSRQIPTSLSTSKFAVSITPATFPPIARCRSSRSMNRSTGACPHSSSPPWTSSPACPGSGRPGNCSAVSNAMTRTDSMVLAPRKAPRLAAGFRRPI